MLIKDRMTKLPLTISEDESLADTHRYMQEQDVRHLPVMNKAGNMVGLVAESDLLKPQPSAATSLSTWEIHYLLDRIKVKDVMIREVITTTEDCPIEEAAQLMLEHKIGCLPVVRKGQLVGMITETDLFRVFLEMFAARQKGLRITMEVPDRAGEFAKVTTAIAKLGGYISASGAFLSEDPTKAGMVMKVRNVDHKLLLDALYADHNVMRPALGNGWNIAITFMDSDMPALWTEAQSLLALSPGQIVTITLPKDQGSLEVRWINGLDYEGMSLSAIFQIEKDKDGKILRQFAHLTGRPIDSGNALKVAAAARPSSAAWL